MKTLTNLSLYKLLKSKGIILDTRISGKGFELKGVAKASYDKGFAIKYTTNIEGVPITLIYKKNVIYVTSGKLKIKGSSKYTYKVLKEVLKKTGVKINQKTLLQAKSFEDAFNSLIKEYTGNLTIKDIIGNVKTFKYKKDYLIIKYKYAKGKVATIKLKKKTLSLATAVLDMNLNAKLKIKKIYTKSPIISVNSKNYTKLFNIINVLEKLGLEDIIASTGIDTDVTLNVAGKNMKANVKANYGNSTALAISTNVTEGKTTIPVSAKYLNNVFYIDVANIHVKAAKDNVESVLSQVLMEQNVSDIFAKDLSTIIKDIVGELSAKDIISNIKSFSCDSKTLKIQYKLNNTNLDIAVTGKTITVKGIKLDKNILDVSAKINNTKNQNITVTDKGQYVDFETAYNIIKSNMNHISNAKAFQLNANIRFGDNQLDADIIYDKTINACKVMIPCEDDSIEVTYLDDVVYVHVGKFSIKITKEKLLKLIEQYSGYDVGEILSGIDMEEQISLALILNIKNITFEDGKFIIEYVQNDTELKAIIEENRDEIDFTGIKINDISVSGKISLERCVNESLINKVDYENDSYLDLDKALDIIDLKTINELMQSEGALFGANVEVNGYALNGQLKVSWEDGIAGQLNTKIEGIETEITMKDDNVYINASNINLVYEKTSQVLSDVVGDGDVSQIIDKITSIQIVDDKIVVQVTSDDTNIEIIITKEQIGIATEINGTKIGATFDIKEIYEKAPDIQVKKAEYSKITDVISVLKKFGIEDLLNATGIEANITLNINHVHMTGKLVYLNENLYLHVGNVYIKTDIEYVLSLLKENGIDIGTEVSIKEIVEKISDIQCSQDKLSLIYHTDTPLSISISGKTVSINDFIEGEIINTNVTEVEDADKYVDLKAVINFVKKWKEQPAVAFHTIIGGRELSFVYENKIIYVEFDELRLKSDDSSVASIINAVLKIYDVDITPVFEWLDIVEDEKDINLDMFKQYADLNAIDNIFKEGNIDLIKIFDNISINTDEISYKGKISESDMYVKLYDSETISDKPATNNYIDVSSIDTLLKAFGGTAANMNFDISGKVNLALSLGLLNFKLNDVPLSAKLKVETEGVYGNVHADVPYMKNVTDSNISAPDTTTETIDATSKTKTEVKTSYSITSGSQVISTDLFVTPNYIYIHKNIKYELTKTITTTKYKKILVWIPQSTDKNTEVVMESKDFYLKRTYKEMQDNIIPDLCFSLNMTDTIKKLILDSINNTDVEDAKLGDIINSYSYDKVNKFEFGLNLSGLTNGAIGNTKVNLYKNDSGYLDNLYAECKLYSLVSIKLDADLNNIGKEIDIGFNPEQLENDEHYK